MKQSGYRTTFHIYLIFFLSLLGTLIAVCCLFAMLITATNPNGKNVRSDQPKIFTQDFSKYIVFVNDTPEIKQTGHFDNAGPEDMTAFIGAITGNEKDYAYVLYFPMNIQKVTVPEPEPLFLSAFQCAKTDTLHLRLIKIE